MRINACLPLAIAEMVVEKGVALAVGIGVGGFETFKSRKFGN